MLTIKTLIFATNNQHKVDELKSIVGSGYDIVSLREAGITIDIPEPFDTLEKNALTKATTIYELTGANCFSEDTGLETEALNGEPGVKSARYAGDDANPENNIQKLLKSLKPEANRKARFRTVISLLFNGEQFMFEGICNGTITFDKLGNGGFGYDPVFMPDGWGKTFGQMELAEKNIYSHRKAAITKLLAHLSLNGNKSSLF